MMLLLIISSALTVGLVVILIGSIVTARPAAVGKRIDEVRRLTAHDPFDIVSQQRRESRRKQVEEILTLVGEKIAQHSGSAGVMASLLTHAGYRKPSAPALFWGIRLALTLDLDSSVSRSRLRWAPDPFVAMLAAVYMAAVGYVVPMFGFARGRARQKDITLALPDAIDLLVVCVEAGLGLNQALLRIAQEIHHVSVLLAQELHLTNLEIRAGRPRNEALRNLTDRTGVEDVRGLMSTLVQAERFGTPIGPALRVHAETLRDKRKQRAREAAAKTTIKLVFPLVLCIFPAMFVVIIGPGLDSDHGSARRHVSRFLRVVNETRQSILGGQIHLADTVLGRMRGFLLDGARRQARAFC
jgi:tight adherence protein C